MVGSSARRLARRAGHGSRPQWRPARRRRFHASWPGHYYRRYRPARQWRAGARSTTPESLGAWISNVSRRSVAASLATRRRGSRCRRGRPIPSPGRLWTEGGPVRRVDGELTVTALEVAGESPLVAARGVAPDHLSELAQLSGRSEGDGRDLHCALSYRMPYLHRTSAVWYRRWRSLVIVFPREKTNRRQPPVYLCHGEYRTGRRRR
jgi:hypothetical protein